MSYATLRRKLKQRRREQQYYTVSDPCRDYGEPYPVEKRMSVSERVFLGVMIVVALIICILSFGRGL